jgi:hypothetical protein
VLLNYKITRLVDWKNYKVGKDKYSLENGFIYLIFRWLHFDKLSNHKRLFIVRDVKKSVVSVKSVAKKQKNWWLRFEKLCGQ